MLNVFGKPPEFFHKKLNEFNKQKHVFAKIATVLQKHCLHRSKLPTELPNIIDWNSLVLPAIEFRKILLANNTVGRRLSDITEYLCDQLTDQLNLAVCIASG
jgi:hypothetical protein